jgi:hypothetical protein
VIVAKMPTDLPQHEWLVNTATGEPDDGSPCRWCEGVRSEVQGTVCTSTALRPQNAVGFGTINDTAGIAVQASYITASRNGKIGGLGYRGRTGHARRR